MAKIQLLVMMTLDGSIIDQYTKDIQSAKICSPIISEIIKDADYELTQDYPISYLLDDSSNEKFVIEATKNSLSYINAILKMGLVSVITIFVLPVLKGDTDFRKMQYSGFQSTKWRLVSNTICHNGVVCLEYVRDL